MAILTPPSSFCGPMNTSFMLTPIVTSSPVSSFNQRSTVSGPLSEFWRAQIVLHGAGPGTSSAPGWRDIAAFLMDLRGGENRARLTDARRSRLRGAGSVSGMAAVAVDAAAGSTTITVKGLIASQALALMKDDHFGIGENLYTVSFSHAASNADGEATIQFLPPLRHGVAEDDPINLTKPTGVFRLTGGFENMSIPHYGRMPPLTLEFFEDPEWEAP